MELMGPDSERSAAPECGDRSPAPRMLTDAEIVRVRQEVRRGPLRPWGDTLDFAAAIAREFCRVNNLPLV